MATHAQIKVRLALIVDDLLSAFVKDFLDRVTERIWLARAHVGKQLRYRAMRLGGTAPAEAMAILNAEP